MTCFYSIFVSDPFLQDIFSILSYFNYFPTNCCQNLGSNCSKHGAFPLCNGEDVLSYYKPLAPCISGTGSKRWIPIQNRSSGSLSSGELAIHGIIV